MKGLGRCYLRGSVYWIEYWHRGKGYRESSHSDKDTVAKRLFKKRLLVSLVVVENRFFGIGAQIFLSQLPYNERSQISQGLSTPPHAAFNGETCLSSRHPSMRRIWMNGRRGRSDFLEPAIVTRMNVCCVAHFGVRFVVQQ